MHRACVCEYTYIEYMACRVQFDSGSVVEETDESKLDVARSCTASTHPRLCSFSSSVLSPGTSRAPVGRYNFSCTDKLNRPMSIVRTVKFRFARTVHRPQAIDLCAVLSNVEGRRSFINYQFNKLSIIF
jgi:hypothetical protein